MPVSRYRFEHSLKLAHLDNRLGTEKYKERQTNGLIGRQEDGQLVTSPTHHGLRSRASPVLVTTDLVNGNSPFLTPHKNDTS